jgi:virginiamycin B lyase
LPIRALALSSPFSQQRAAVANRALQGVEMRPRIVSTFLAMMMAVPAAHGQSVAVQESPVAWEGRPRDPDLDAQGLVWFVGQRGNYIGRLDPATATCRRYELEDNTLPHNLIVAGDGGVWYAGNGNARIGRLDPATSDVRVFPMPDPAARDPHTLAFDGRASIWFTVQGGGHVSRLDMRNNIARAVLP